MKARCNGSGKFVAVKKFDCCKTEDPKIEAALEEGKMHQRLKHKNIVEYLDVFEPTNSDPNIYIVMELMDCSLHNFLSDDILA